MTSKLRRIAAGLAVGILLTPIAAGLAVMSAGAGHGDYGFARALFPYTLLLTRLTGDSITLPLMGIALLQFPLYGALIGTAHSRKAAGVTAALVLAVHTAAALICFSGAIPNFS